ncbi:MAG: hypothetical protein GX819_06045 [Clostridiaceae bacterium]|nr:hypothetical protein [Clostridiaceae bacterium]
MSKLDEKKKDEVEKLRKKLTFSFKNLWDPENEKEMKAVMAFCEDYKEALDQGKTEREFVDSAVGLLRSEGYRE